jgi:two-component system nitrogen regulation sensor histidine kinase NtrY
VAKETSPRIEVRTDYDRDAASVRIEVADNGSGVPNEIKARLFEPYFSTKPEGTGLGLAIVASIVAEHQAYVRVFDNQPKGARFVLEFPVRSSAVLHPPALAV